MIQRRMRNIRSEPIEKSSDLNICLDRLAFYLARRDHSEKELRTKLGRKFTSEVINQALESAKQQKWLKSPEELSELVAQALHRKHKGHVYIRRFLQKKGLPGLLPEETKELEKAQYLLKMKFGSIQDFDFEIKRKAYRFLAYRGFEDHIIKKVLYEKS